MPKEMKSEKQENYSTPRCESVGQVWVETSGGGEGALLEKKSDVMAKNVVVGGQDGEKSEGRSRKGGNNNKGTY